MYKLKYRHEIKHPISYSDLITIRARLNAVAKLDPHADNGKYFIKSLYFDTPTDKYLKEKVDGLDMRSKFRIRIYNNNTDIIHLEKKCRHHGLCLKISENLTKEDTQKIIDNDISFLKTSDKPLLNELYCKMTNERLAPKTIVAYTRQPYIYKYGNVRVTFDYDIRTGLSSTEFLNSDTPIVSAGDPIIILEVKWDEYLPSVIRDIVWMPGRMQESFSKYERCRIYD